MSNWIGPEFFIGFIVISAAVSIGGLVLIGVCIGWKAAAVVGGVGCAVAIGKAL